MCLDPLTMTGMALGGAGTLIGGNEAAANAQAVAHARNAVLQDNLKRQDAFATENRGTFDQGMQAFAPGAQGQKLADAQTTRATDVTTNIAPPADGAIKTVGSAPDAVKGAIAKSMLAAFRTATDRAKNAGNLASYGDVTQGNDLGVNNSARNVGVVNNFSRGQGALLQPLQDLAEVAAYRPPSGIGQLMQFAGNVLGGAGARRPGVMFPGATGTAGAGTGLFGAGGGANLFPAAQFNGVGAYPY